MRVAFARNLFFPEDFGGNRYPFEVVQRLIARGHEVTVVTGRLLGQPKRQVSGARFLTFGVSRVNPLATHFTNVAWCLPVLWRALKGRPDVLVVSSYDVALSSLLLRRLWPALPLVFIYHSEFYSEWAVQLARSNQPLKRAAGQAIKRYMTWVQQTVLAGATAIVAVSEFSGRQIVESAPAARNNLHVIPTGVDTEHFRANVSKRESKMRLGLDPDRAVAIAVGRLSHVKGLDILLGAVALLRDQGSAPLTLIVGDGPERPALEAQLRRLDLAGVVTMTGYKNAAELVNYMQAADLQVCSSRFENHSLAIIEALACGTPVAGTPNGGTPEILRRVDERLVFSGDDEAAIAAGLLTLLSNLELLSELGRRGRELAVACYDWSHVIAQLEALLQEVTQRSTPA